MKLKIIPNPEKEWAVQLAKELEPFLARLGHAVEASGADATICIGGDGTVLYSNHMGMLEGPVIGIGSETSYICQLTRASHKEELERLLESKRTVPVMSLDAEVGGKRQNALNDFVVHSSDHRVIGIEVRDNRGHYGFKGDGIIISSSLGSAGHAYSAGGERLEPLERRLSVVPICPYRRRFEPALYKEDASIEVKADRGCSLISDGIFLQGLKKDETVTIRKGRDIMFFEGVGFYKQG